MQLNGRELVGRPERELQRVRGKEISLVYQDPMSALDPVKTIGRQLVETIRQHDRGISPQGRAQGRARSCCATSRCPSPSAGSTTTRTSTRAACASA